MAPYLLLSSLLLTVSAVNLYATHYDGNIYSLTLDRTPNDTFSLSVSSSVDGCGSMPSWLTLDPASRILYCSDETGDANSQGTLTALYVDGDGSLTEIASTDTIGGGVSSVIYDGGHGAKYIAIAHYQGSAVSTFRLPLKSNQSALQEFRYHLTKPGPVADRQEAPHQHHVFLDPTGSFILSPDLGGDLVRVYSINRDSGQLDECPSLNVSAGNGPRHGDFWTLRSLVHKNQQHQHNLAAPPATTLLYMVNELSGNLTAYSVSYPESGCLSFNETQSLVPYPGGKLPDGATLSEIRLVDNFAYVSIRSDQGFAPNDSMTTLSHSGDGTVVVGNRTSSYGTVPRTFVVNKAGDLVAIGNQASSNVAIVKRDQQTGALGEKVASVDVGTPGKVGTAEGLSSVVWEE